MPRTTHTVPDSGTIISETLLHIQTAHEANNWSKLLADRSSGAKVTPTGCFSSPATALGQPTSPHFSVPGPLGSWGAPCMQRRPQTREQGAGGSCFGRVPWVRPTQGCACSGDISAGSPCSCSPCRAPSCSLTHLSNKPPAFRGTRPRPFLAPAPPNHQAYTPY